jgi:hypothetical protein
MQTEIEKFAANAPESAEYFVINVPSQDLASQLDSDYYYCIIEGEASYQILRAPQNKPFTLLKTELFSILDVDYLAALANLKISLVVDQPIKAIRLRKHSAAGLQEQSELIKKLNDQLVALVGCLTAQLITSEEDRDLAGVIDELVIKAKTAQQAIVPHTDTQLEQLVLSITAAVKKDLIF